jgi:3-oxocholest-4-en-26-oyl-CoA dehydrogenase alpha subunit
VDFSRVELSDEDQAFLDRAREFLAAHVTGDVARHERETGDGFNADLHLAMGAGGWLAGELNTEEEGGFGPIQGRLWELEKRRVDVPWETWGTTRMVAHVVRAYGSPEVRQEVLPGVLRGEIRFCLGYTEPEGGSDIATCKTRAVRDGDQWVITGSKMFTTGAHNCQYVFLLTNTDPEAPKHKSLTMFLVPLDSAGIEIQGIRTVDGDRTNIVYYSDVRVDDKYRLGDVNGGWKVLMGPLAAEHGDTAGDASGLSDIAVMAHHGLIMAEVVDNTVVAAGATGADGGRALDDDSVGYRLGRGFARL